MPVKYGAGPGEKPSAREMKIIEEGTEAFLRVMNQIRNKSDGEIMWGAMVSAIVSDMATLMAQNPSAARKFPPAYAEKAQALVDAIKAMTPEMVEKIMAHPGGRYEFGKERQN